MCSALNNLNADFVGNHVARASSPASSGGVPPPGKVAGKGWLDAAHVLSFSERRAGTPALRDMASDHSKTKSGFHFRGVLPHLERNGAAYFVSFRLAGTLPKEVLIRFKQER